MQFKYLMEIDGQLKPHPFLNISNFSVGNLSIANTQAIFSPQIRANEFPGPKLDGLLGVDFLKHFLVIFNFPKKMIYIYQSRRNLVYSRQ